MNHYKSLGRIPDRVVREGMARIMLPALLLCAGVANGENWPQFRGPQADGLNTNAAVPIHWNLERGENVRWRASIPGLGHSSPIVWGDRIYVTTAVAPGQAELKVGLYGDITSADDLGPQQWRLLALDAATGKVLWNQPGFAGVPRTKRHPKSTYCSSTPATDGQHIVAIFGSEGLFCFDMDGHVQWHKDLGPMASAYYLVPSAQWGFASSPIIHDGKVVVLCDVLTNSFLAEVAVADGKEIWRTPRTDVPTWGTPALATSGGQTQILISGWHHTGGYDFVSGKEIWRLNGGGDIPVPTPIVGRGLAYFTSAHGSARPMRAIRLDATGDITPSDLAKTNAAIAWVKPKSGNYMQTPLLIGGLLYACFDTGPLSCFDAATGELHYTEKMGNGTEGFTSSAVSDGRNLFVASEIGNIYVVPIGVKFAVAATNVMNETCMATPAMMDGTLIYRTRNQVIAIAAKAEH